MRRYRNRFTGNISAHYYYSHFHRNRNRSRAVETQHKIVLLRGWKRVKLEDSDAT